MESIYEYLEKTNTKEKDGHYLWKAKCKVCGKIIYTRKRHKTISCHHYYSKHYKISNEDKITRLTNIYYLMISRCYNKKCKDYKFYGYKGIKICDEWLENYYNFQNWAINNGYKDDLTIDRIDVNKNYEPSNCRWITRSNNCRFKSTTNYIEVNNIVMSGRQWSKKLNKGINYINNMIKKYGLNYTKNYIKNNI